LPKSGFRTITEYLASSPPNETLKFEPGTKYDYSNYGYLLLGAIIEKASGQNYYDYIRDHIYKPAGMTNSDSYELNTDPPNLAAGYEDGPNGSRLNNIFKLPVKGMPFGLGYSTVEDLLKFHMALRDGKLLSAKSLEIVWTGKVDAYVDNQYGYGFFVKRYNGTRIVGHGGGYDGITNQMDMYPDLGYTVVILNNIDSEPSHIAYKLREWLTQGQP
jgi:D-alanyl-D-alanine carboxypeptidase